MKQYWEKLASKIDSLTLRERAVIFAMIAAVMVAAANAALLDPLFARQKLLSSQIQAGRTQTNLIRAQISETIKGPETTDAAGKARLEAVRKQQAQMQSLLLDMQKGLVSPDKMTVLLEDIVRQGGRLRLISLKTLPASGLSDPEPGAKTPEKGAVTAVSAPKTPEGAGGAVYKHGVEITLQGGYVDIVNYMAALETMPWQLFWGKAKLSVDEYPTATLTLTLFTLSLDKKWLNM
jgi:MSHA biogenesis protein MshJ